MKTNLLFIAALLMGCGQEIHRETIKTTPIVKCRLIDACAAYCDDQHSINAKTTDYGINRADLKALSDNYHCKESAENEVNWNAK